MQEQLIFQDIRKHYREDKSTELYQAMQNSHAKIRQLAQENTETAIERNIKDHDSKAYPRFFKVGVMVLLQVKNFLNKNQKLVEGYKGPYIFTKISDNNTATIKMKHGTKEYNYNKQMFKLFHQEKFPEK